MACLAILIMQWYTAICSILYHYNIILYNVVIYVIFEY